MADSKLTTQYRCGYCYLEFNSMTDPRELPCYHVFCITCLQGDYTDNNNICCRSCQRVYTMETFDHLPTASLDTEVVVDTSISLTCDCHNCDGQNAVCYCVTCADKMCYTHQQAHCVFFGDRHEVISIATYESRPGIYKKIFCEHHNVELIRACQKCNCFICKECDLHEMICSGMNVASVRKKCSCGHGALEQYFFVARSYVFTGTENMHHMFRPLNKLKEELSAHFNSLLQSASEKLTEICKLDKHIWKVLDEEEVECKKRIEMIERIRDEQIEVIRKESEKLKEQIYEYQKTLTDQVELYNTELMDKKEKLEESRTKVHKWLRESHVTEKLQQKQQMTEELRENTDIELDCQLTRTPHIIRTDEILPLDMKLVNLPTSITFKSEQRTGRACYSASYREDGDLLLGCSDGVRLLSQHNMQMSKIDSIDLSITSVIACDRNVFILHCVGEKWTVNMYLPDLKRWTELFSFSYTGNIVTFAAVSKRYVVVIDRDEHKLVFYEFLTKQTFTLQPVTSPWHVCFLPDGDLLVSSTDAANLTRYRIENRELTLIWTCEELVDARRVCTDADGLIYAITSRRLIYIISPDGVKLHTIQVDKLPSLPGEISIRGRDELAVPSWGDNSVCLFKINR